MSDYSQAIFVPTSLPRDNYARGAEVTWRSALILPSFGIAVFAVTLFQVLFMAQGAQGLFRDSDTGWHIRNGETILNTGGVPRADSFSYTRNGMQWFAWEWLSDAMFGKAHRVAGVAGAALLAGLSIAISVWAAARLSLSLGGNLFFTAGATIVLLGTTSIHWLARPHVFSWLIAIVFLSIVEHERRRPSRATYLLPLLACLWANLHGSFLLGPAILFIYGVGEWAEKFPSFSRRGGREAAGVVSNSSQPPRLRFAQPPLLEKEGNRSFTHSFRFFAASLGSLLATFINPYGWHLHDHVFRYLDNAYLMDHIAEFRSFSFHAPGALYVELFLMIAVVGTLALLKQRAFGPAMLALGLLHMSLYSARHLPTAALLLLPLFVAALSREAENWSSLRAMLAYSDRLRAIDGRIWGTVPAVLVLAAAIAGTKVLADAGGVGFNPSMFPVRAAAFLEKQQLDGRIFSKDQWGGYLIYRFAGRTKVFMDGRSDFYGQDLLETYAQVVEVRPGWDSVLKQYDVRFVMIPRDHALASALQLHSRWKLIYADSVADIFERAG